MCALDKYIKQHICLNAHGQKCLCLLLEDPSYPFFLTCLLILFFFRYITQEGHKLEVGAPRPPATVTNAVSWRSEGIKYRKNEVFMDVIESVNLLVRTFHPC